MLYAICRVDSATIAVVLDLSVRLCLRSRFGRKLCKAKRPYTAAKQVPKGYSFIRLRMGPSLSDRKQSRKHSKVRIVNFQSIYRGSTLGGIPENLFVDKQKRLDVPGVNPLDCNGSTNTV